jgi:hypothetical protein
VKPPTVNGKTVKMLHALVSPAAFLSTKDIGSHEITRCFYDPDSGYSIGYQTNRIGPHELLEARVDSVLGIELIFSGGYTVLIPQARVQATYQE